jgi:hypothetical protein
MTTITSFLVDPMIIGFVLGLLIQGIIDHFTEGE